MSEKKSSNKESESKKPKVALIDLVATLDQKILASVIDGLIVDVIFIIFLITPLILQILAIIKLTPVLTILSVVGWSVSVPLACIASFFYLVFCPLYTKGFTIGMKRIGIRFITIPDIKSKKIKPLGKEDFVLSLKRTLFSIVDLLGFGLVGIILINKSAMNQSFAERMLDIIVIEHDFEEKDS